MEEKIQKLRRVRAGLKGSITNITRDLDEFLEAASVSERNGKKDTIKSTLARIEKINNELYDLYDDDELVVEEINTDLLYVEKINIIIASLNNTRTQTPPTTQAVKLPKLTLPQFNGDPLQWESFWDSFECAVDTSNIAPVQKLTYLKGQLSGEAQQLIASFKLKDENYFPAVQLLKSTYGRSDKTKTALVSNLCELSPPSYDHTELKQFHATLESIIRSINNQDISRDEMCAIIVLNKLPSPLKENLRRELKEGILNCDTLLNAFQEELSNVTSTTPKQIQPASTVSFQVGEIYQTATSPGKQGAEVKQNERGTTCLLCDGKHAWYKCLKYPNAEKKVNQATKLKLCVGCLAKDHGRVGCTNPNIYTCKFCGAKHYHSLCTGAKGKGSQTSNTTATTLSVTTSKNITILPTIAIPLKDKNGHAHYARALLDQCSQKTFILQDTLAKIQHTKIGSEYLQIQGFTGSAKSKSYDKVTFSYKYRGRYNNLQALVVDKLPCHKIHNSINAPLKQLERQGYKLADPHMSQEGGMELLIGADAYYNLVHPGYYKEGKLILLPTKFGYAISGSYNHRSSSVKVETVAVLKVATNPIDNFLNKPDYTPCPNDLNALWDLDHIGILPHEKSLKDQKIFTSFENTISYDPNNNQYMVQLPWKVDKNYLPNNYGLAMGRLRGLQKKFIKDPDYCDKYTKVLNDQLEQGFVEEVEHPTIEGGHYLAHHGVHKDSPTTPVRIVFDCSAKTNVRQYSLNDCLYTGPSLVSDLTKMLLKFRINQYACVSDIEKAFLMIKLHPNDRDVTRFLWPTDPQDINSPCKTYRFTVVLFGATCSQFLLNATILKHLSNLPPGETVEKIKDGLYIDNLQGTDNAEQGLIEQYWEALKIFSAAHLTLREWATNSNLLKKQLEQDGKAATNQNQVKVLGLLWNTDDDSLRFQPRAQQLSENTITKRTCLSLIASVFDPLGLLLPVTIRGRLIIQELWKSKLDWDDPLPPEIQNSWSKLTTDIQQCTMWQISRKITSAPNVKLHVFSDASNKAYGAVAYLCTADNTKLVMGKAKVAPLKTLTIPKLELTAVLLASRLIKFIHEAYINILNFTTYLWCDSQIAIYWIKSQNTLPVYVANRVEEIHALTANVHLRYVATQDNPADLLTRGLTSEELAKSSLWWQGPSWLPIQDNWPINPVCEGHIPGALTTAAATTTTTIDPQQPHHLLSWERFSNFDKLIRTWAWVRRFISNILAKGRSLAFTTDSVLSLGELKEAEKEIVEQIQLEGFPKESNLLKQSADKGSYTNIMMQLGLYIQDGVIKCKGRIQLAQCSETAKHPTLLPNSHHVTKLLIHRYHIINNHYGTNYTMGHMREKWWIPKMRQAIKRELNQCMKCKRHQAKSYSKVDAPPLPHTRVTQSEPFQITGVDYTGALQIRTKQNKNEISKAYVVLFTCAVTRACHLELVTDLTTQSFLFALRRFSSRRGFPQLILSDNATTFSSAAQYLSQLQNDPSITDFLSARQCEWQFIPARAPWFGAIWERMIGTLKMGLRKVLGKALVTQEELYTILLEIEVTINNRPLTYVSSDIDEPNPITPSQLIQGRRINSVRTPLVVEDLSDPSFNSKEMMLERVRYIEKLSVDIWKRWTREYLFALREEHQCLIKDTNIIWPKVGDIVLIHDDGPKSLWKLARVVNLLRGQDGASRVAEIKTPVGITTRPVVKLYPLEQDLEIDPPQATNSSGSAFNQRPTRRAALGSTQLWQAKIKQGLL